MEKFSQYRDPATGIQPFLTPVPPHAASTIAQVLFVLGFVVGTLRTLVVLTIALVYSILQLLVYPLKPISSVYDLVVHVITAVLGRISLLILGIAWIKVETVSRKRGRPSASKEVWSPKAGDIIVSNWTSWIEIVWLAIRFNPVFVLGVAEPPVPSTASLSSVPGRKTGTGSAAISSPAKTPSAKAPIVGFVPVSLLKAISSCGKPPLSLDEASIKPQRLDDIRRSKSRPIAVFPELTSSNGRALLRFANVFGDQSSVPIKGYNVFVMCVRYDPPTNFSPTLTLSIPSSYNPLRHIFQLSRSFSFSQTPFIRLLAPSESPSSGAILASEFLTSSGDQASEACAVLISQIGKLKRVSQGWEDKISFLEFYARTKHVH
ncbi:hypothetical protein SISNIDRAFT_546835 [Sistotremastrum niveocremeum HHB9708]|uniref:Phospholipid/glycerol acyltransferase domain-containing protein n=2 Tax=Sistotremastraceae TaxID=3402574 RepID=A0A164ZJH5_9AGAM|nr:hypothetical protein SISNIDRAFT_546835 [Sistotremastrum niveocremeum HHB9708]KZT42905.1 hypothetical protein SISSUDRAFT_1112295 [Sistotremastrum suecicum HHB10207 ss-3]